ncbi:MAG: hypothetical protein FJ395_01340 [Verrucomicrobia bacterium]|nr:hypothetical protein [Verrucomicrobiota bacterium]
MIVFKAPVILIVAFGLVELLVLGFLFSLWFGSVTVTVNNESVSIVRSALRWRRERVVPVADITGFRLDVGMTASTPAGTSTYHNIKLVLRNGKTHTVGCWIENRLEAEWLAAEMARCTGIGTAAEIS